MKRGSYFYDVDAGGQVGCVRESTVLAGQPYVPPTGEASKNPCGESQTGILYEITGERVYKVDLTWENDKGGTSQGSSGLPVCKRFYAFSSGEFLNISAQITSGEGDTRCRIYDHGRIVAEATADGFASIATCRGSAR
jgi:hypothetical protein